MKIFVLGTDQFPSYLEFSDKMDDLTVKLSSIELIHWISEHYADKWAFDNKLNQNRFYPGEDEENAIEASDMVLAFVGKKKDAWVNAIVEVAEEMGKKTKVVKVK